MFCPKCGKEIIEGTKFCTKCGTPFNFINTDDINEERKVTQQEIETNEVGRLDYSVKADKKFRMPVVIATSVLIALVVISAGVYFLFFMIMATIMILLYQWLMIIQRTRL